MRAALPCLIFVAISAGPIAPASAQDRASSARTRTGTTAPGTSTFFGGVPSGTATAEPLALSIVDAIARALEHNLGLLLAEQNVGRAEGARWDALAGMLPTINGRISESRQMVNLAAFGFPLPAGFPAIVGPFNVFDARLYVSQPVLDFQARHEVRAEEHNIAAAQHAYKGARDLVVLVAANAYLQGLAAAARAESAAAQLRTAEAIFGQATSLRQSGLVAGIDVLRAEVQLNLERQRATAARNDFDKAKLQLARLIGLPLGQPVTLTDQMPFTPVPETSLEAALDQAYRTRPDYLAALERVRAAEASQQAAAGEKLPSLTVRADFGDIGLSVGDSHGTYAVVGALNVPIFQGGRSKGRQLSADAELRSRRAEAEDLRAGIYYDVRMALLDLQATSQQLDVAARARELAAEQLTQARDRFAAGIATNIEIVQAQQAVALASEQYISALYGSNIAKAALAQGLGIAEQAVRQSLGGIR